MVKKKLMVFTELTSCCTVVSFITAHMRFFAFVLVS